MRILSVVIIAVVALLLSACADEFAAPFERPSGTGSSALVYTRVSWNPLYTGLPSGDIVQQDIFSGGAQVLIPGPATLLCEPRNGSLLYAALVASDTATFWEIRLRTSDGATHVVLPGIVSFGPLKLDNAALSPDGRKVAYILDYRTEDISVEHMSSTIMLYDSEDGRSIAVDSCTTDIHGGMVTLFYSQLEFSPDGRYLAAAQWGPQSQIKIYTVANGSLARRIQQRTGPFVAWSPDSRSLAFTRSNSGGQVLLELQEQADDGLIYRMPYFHSFRLTVADVASGGEELLLSTGLPPTQELAWSPDATRLAVAVCRTYPGLDAADPTVTDIMTVNIQNKTVDTLVYDPSSFYKLRPGWSPDSKRLVYTEGLAFGASFLSSGVVWVGTVPSAGNVHYGEPSAFGAYWMQ